MSSEPILPEQWRRVLQTVRCRDTDAVPKVPEAGQVLVQDGGVRVQVMHEGTRIVEGCYYGAWMTEIIRRLQGHHEPQEELVVHRVLERLQDEPSERRRVVVELGSFWAYYAMWSMRATGARAILVEPDPANLDVGRRNLELNGLSATFVHAAVGGAHGSMTRLACESDGVERDLPVVTVPGLVEEHGIDLIDLLLVDVQGAELDVLERSLQLMRDGRVRFLVLSTHHHEISGDPLTHQRCRDLLESLDAHVVAEHTVGESFSGDGLVAVGFDPADRDLTVPISYARHRDSLFGEPEHELAALCGEVQRLRRALEDGGRPQRWRPSLRVRRRGR